MSPILQAVAAWLLAYAVHSTLLLGAAALLAGRVRDYAWRETLWKCALVGAVLTVTAQTLADYRPPVGRWSVSITRDAAPNPTAPTPADRTRSDVASPAASPTRDAAAAAAASASTTPY